MKNQENHGVKELYSLVFKRYMQAQSKNGVQLARAMCCHRRYTHTYYVVITI